MCSYPAGEEHSTGGGAELIGIVFERGASAAGGQELGPRGVAAARAHGQERRLDVRAAEEVGVPGRGQPFLYNTYIYTSI